ncbi:hypothetical protein [Sphingomonas sp. 3-13AW]|uniref:hypothetical protein n=1 Tax=Sphingomonas sp. 3-13AW TaxID=3050450 RepID=UPI003BB7F2E0
MEYGSIFRPYVFDQAAHEARLAAELAERQEVQRRSLEAMAKIVDPRELAMVQAVDQVLSRLGDADAYLSAIGGPATRALQKALAAYGVTPDYGVGSIRETLATN